MSNPYFYTSPGGTDPLEVVLLGGDGQPVRLQGATVEFAFYGRGGVPRFQALALVVDPQIGKVLYQWQPGQVPQTRGRYLGRFIVTFSTLEKQNFPSDRYLEVVVT